MQMVRCKLREAHKVTPIYVGQMPREGRPCEYDSTPFGKVAALRADLVDGRRVFNTTSTSNIRVSLDLENFSLTWCNGSGDVVAADLNRRSYTRDGGESRMQAHYMTRAENDIFVGLGETSGAVNKHGRRFVMQPSDALGYNAELSDPLYKHWPFFISYSPTLKCAYGIFYDTFAKAAIDLGSGARVCIFAWIMRALYTSRD
jgi:alpha-glucosidase (family GH31 glycosyl hydrolase)